MGAERGLRTNNSTTAVIAITGYLGSTEIRRSVAAATLTRNSRSAESELFLSCHSSFIVGCYSPSQEFQQPNETDTEKFQPSSFHYDLDSGGIAFERRKRKRAIHFRSHFGHRDRPDWSFRRPRIGERKFRRHRYYAGRAANGAIPRVGQESQTVTVDASTHRAGRSPHRILVAS